MFYLVKPAFKGYVMPTIAGAAIPFAQFPDSLTLTGGNFAVVRHQTRRAAQATRQSYSSTPAAERAPE